MERSSASVGSGIFRHRPVFREGTGGLNSGRVPIRDEGLRRSPPQRHFQRSAERRPRAVCCDGAPMGLATIQARFGETLQKIINFNIVVAENPTFTLNPTNARTSIGNNQILWPQTTNIDFRNSAPFEDVFLQTSFLADFTQSNPSVVPLDFFPGVEWRWRVQPSRLT
jgi:hypothetical protein